MITRTCLWFDADGHEAAAFYASVIDECEVTETVDPPAPDTPNTVPGVPLFVNFEIAGQRYQALNGGPHFAKSEYASIVLECATQEQADRYWDGLLAGGGTESQCGWLTDRFGVSWQVVPVEMYDLMSDPEVSEKAFASMLTMRRLDVAQMRRDCGR